MLFYDIEAFPYYWCVVIVDEENSTRHVFEDVPSLQAFYKQNMDNVWIGYNSRQYDAPMLRFIMLGLDPFECSQDLIVLGKKWFQFPYQIVERYKRIPLKNYDCVLLNKGLKKLEGFRGSSIRESEIDWNFDQPLTREQKDQTIAYCTHDVLEMRKVFYDTIEEYEAHEALINAFSIHPSHFSKSKAQLVALILKAEKRKWYDEWSFEIADTLIIEKYKFVEEWYRDPANHDYYKTLKAEIAGVPHELAWGGIHGARLRYGGTGIYINMDVASYYPALMIEYGYLSRNVPDPEIYRKIRDERIVLKKNKDPKQLPYKIVLNSTYGASKDKFNNLYDPRQANSICITGQLFLIDLIEKVEPYCELIQSNTDGILVRVDNEEQAKMVEKVSQEWSKRTRMELEYERYTSVFQKDVNNYLIVPEGDLYYESGMPAWKAKGAWAKPWYKEVKIDGKKTKVEDYIEYDSVILKKALHNYFVLGIPVEQTINECDRLIEFQKIVMISSKYSYALHGDQIVREKHLRVFASTNEQDGGIFKLHAIKKNLNKASDTPVHAFIVNDNIEDAKASDYPLDKQYYINMANDRVKKFVKKEKVS